MFKPPEDRPAFETVVDAFAFAVEASPDRLAVRCGHRSLTYAELGAAVAALAQRLVAQGCRGERVALAMRNDIETPVAIFGGLAAGAQVALLNPAYPRPALLPLLEDADPTAILSQDGALLASLAGASSAASVVVDVGELVGEGGDLPAERPRQEDLATLMYTGGTTGVSKGVDHTHWNLMRTVEGMEACWPTRVGEEVWLSVAPLFHIWGLLMGCLNPVYGRATVRLLPAFDPSSVVRLLEEDRTTVFGGGPAAIYAALLAVPGIDVADLQGLRVCPGGGSPFTGELLRRWDTVVGVPIYEAFGMSEAAPITANPYDGVRKPGSVGVPTPGMELSIVGLDDSGPLPTGEVGEICVRSDRQLLRYRNRPDETSAALVDGWLRTGDVGFVDADGYLYIVDRKKDMLLVGGFNVYPREIDELLCSHSDVHEAATIGIPDDRKGERPLSFVTLSPGRAVIVEDLLELCRRNLVDYKVPSAIMIVESIPKTAANKTDRQALRRTWRERAGAGSSPRQQEPSGLTIE